MTGVSGHGVTGLHDRRFRSRSDRTTRRGRVMAWIKTVSPADVDERVRRLLSEHRALYPTEYREPVPAFAAPPGELSGIVGSHSLIPEALYHAFSTFGVLMSPDLPLSRREHEMIATMVSVTNRCIY